MRKAILAALVALCVLTGCGTGDNTARTTINPENTNRFECEYGYVSLITDTRTGCQYLAWWAPEKGGVTLLVDKYGYPMLAEGYTRLDVGMSEDDGE